MNESAKTFELTAPVDSLPVANDPMQMLGAALDRGMSVADPGPLMDLVERDQKNKARTAFMAAMASFQAACPTIKKSSQADRYTFAGLDEVLRTIRPHLDAAGLSVRFDTELTGDTIITAICYIMHVDGHTQSNRFSAPIDRSLSKAGKPMMNSLQQVGSARSYCKRYALMDALNLVGSELDDDGAGAGTVEPVLTDEQVATLRDHTEELKGNEQKFAESLGADCLENVAASRWPQAMTTIERHLKAREGKE